MQVAEHWDYEYVCVLHTHIKFSQPWYSKMSNWIIRVINSAHEIWKVKQITPDTRQTVVREVVREYCI